MARAFYANILTKVILFFLKFLMSHQFLESTGHGLYVIDDHFIQISEFVFALDNQLAADILARQIRVGFEHICK